MKITLVPDNAEKIIQKLDLQNFRELYQKSQSYAITNIKNHFSLKCNCGYSAENPFPSLCPKCGKNNHAEIQRSDQLVKEVLNALSPRGPSKKHSPKSDEIPIWERLYDEGNKLLNERRLEEALDKYYQALQLKDDDHELLTNTGVAYLHMGKLEEGLKWLDRSLRVKPNNRTALFNKGKFFFYESRYDESVEAFEILLKYNPDFARARRFLMNVKRHQQLFLNLKNKEIPPEALEQFRKGIKFLDIGKGRDALNAMKLAIATFPKFGEAYMYSGLIKIEIGGINDGLKDLDKALEIDPKLVRAWTNKGWAYDKMEQFQKAIECYDEAIKIDPFFSSAWNNKGLALKSLGRNEDAIKAFNKAIEINPDFEGSYYNLAAAYKNIGKIERAIENYQKVLEFNPNNEDAQENIDILRRYSSPNKEGVIRIVTDARDYCPRCNKKNYTNSEKCPYCGTVMFSDNTEKLLEEAVKLEAKGNFELALTNFVRINNKDPTNYQAWFYRGKAHCALAEFRNAIACFAKAQELGFGAMQLMMYGMIAKSNISHFQRPNLSEKHLKKVEIRSPGFLPDEESWQAHGAAYQMLMQYEEAYKSYQIALQIKPDYTPALKNRDFLIKLSK